MRTGTYFYSLQEVSLDQLLRQTSLLTFSDEKDDLILHEQGPVSENILSHSNGTMGDRVKCVNLHKMFLNALINFY